MKKLLAIVDDWEKLEVYEDRLKSRFEVSCAPFGYYGMEMAREMASVGRPPDVILIDLVMEDMDEFEAEALLLKDPELSRIPRILVTDSKSVEHPLSQIVVRPYQFNDLVKILLAAGN